VSWGCKPENYPDGCGWSQRITYAGGWTEWWCDSCERAGDIVTVPKGELPGMWDESDLSGGWADTEDAR
jgi:hypothetical protein